MLENDNEDVESKVVVHASPGITNPAFKTLAAGKDLDQRHAEEIRRGDTGQGCQPKQADTCKELLS